MICRCVRASVTDDLIPLKVCKARSDCWRNTFVWISLATKLLLLVGKARGREYIWTLFPWTFALMLLLRGSNLVQIWTHDFLHTSLYTSYLITMAMTTRVQEQHPDKLLLNSQVAGSCGCGRSSTSSRWNYRSRTLSRRRVAVCLLNGLSRSDACQCAWARDRYVTE